MREANPLMRSFALLGYLVWGFGKEARFLFWERALFYIKSPNDDFGFPRL